MWKMDPCFMSGLAAGEFMIPLTCRMALIIFFL